MHLNTLSFCILHCYYNFASHIYIYQRADGGARGGNNNIIIIVLY